MNQLSEQITAEFNILIDKDEPLSSSQLKDSLRTALKNQCINALIESKEVLLLIQGEKKTILLPKAISYLGNPHPIFKKRIQIPRDWVSYAQKVRKKGFEIKFIGIYHYKGFKVFADFRVEDYIRRNCHNSSAHVYINDLYQGAVNGTFDKVDQNGNHITTIAFRKLESYLNGTKNENKLLKMFAQFNFGFPFGKWMTAITCIEEMHKKNWSQWRQAEWQGWFLEYKFASFTKRKGIHPFIEYTALQNKGHKQGQYDFDIWFPEEQFMGDLKTSDIMKKESPGNDQESFVECINRYGKFWYIIYEHETEYDRNHEFEATRWRNKFISKIDGTKRDLMSYSQRMKNSVCFRKMLILELNRINYHNALSDFNQGHQPDGSQRKAKFLIKKNALDNFVIYRYEKE